MPQITVLQPSPMPQPPIQRLGSPIHLQDSPSRRAAAAGPSTPRRRSKGPASIPRRRRTSSGECRVISSSRAFDQLPWISSLDSAPEFTNPWDIADLSLLVDPELSPSGPGPVRRRKTSLRSSPLDIPDASPSPSRLPFRDTSLLPPLSAISTPRSRFIPSRVLFQNLMPISLDGPLA